MGSAHFLFKGARTLWFWSGHRNVYSYAVVWIKPHKNILTILYTQKTLWHSPLQIQSSLIEFYIDYGYIGFSDKQYFEMRNFIAETA